MSGNTATPRELGDRRCSTCGKVHDAYVKDGPKGKYLSWASLDDGHFYRPESWDMVARRYGYTFEKERAA